MPVTPAAANSIYKGLYIIQSVRNYCPRPFRVLPSFIKDNIKTFRHPEGLI